MGLDGSFSLIDPYTLESFPAILDEELARELAVPAKKAETTAKRVHKYKNRTGLLESSTHVKVRSQIGTKAITTRVEGYIDGRADYAEDIINGTGSRVADPFLTEAIKNTGPEFERAMDRAVSKSADRLVKGKQV